MSEIRITDANKDLASLIAALEPGEEVIVIDEGKRIAVLLKEPKQDFSCQAGSASGKILFMSDDFDGHQDDFAEYM